MALNYKFRLFIKCLTYWGMALGMMIALARPFASSAAVKAGIAIRCHNAISTNRVRTITVLPGEIVTFQVVNCDPGLCYLARSAGGNLTPMGTGCWEWTSPHAPGFYPIQVATPDSGDTVIIEAFVVVPYDRLKGEFLNGYRIGRYPKKQLSGLPSLPGFVEVTKKNEDVLVSPHFRLKQFLCKQQPSASQKYLVLNERLPLALEYILTCVNKAGYRATTFHIMSGYRTPCYNCSLGNVRYSLHQWGAAADIFIDENGDGIMDDLNGDGFSDIRDAEVLYRLINNAAAQPEAQGLIGGLSKYPPTVAHGPFVHVDVRGRKARW